MFLLPLFRYQQRIPWIQSQILCIFWGFWDKMWVDYYKNPK